MDKNQAFQLLNSSSPHDRLQAARYLSKCSVSTDYANLSNALAVETDTWVRHALNRTILNLRSANVNTTPPLIDSIDLEDLEDDLYAQAIEETTRRLVHELEPILGTIRYYAAQEISNYQESSTYSQLNRFESLIRAIETLSRAAAPPSVTESLNRQLQIRKAGPSQLLINSDSTLIELALRNGLRNAIEAIEQIASPEHNLGVIVTWGTSDKHHWIAVLDNGPGLPPGSRHIFDIGTTTKVGHLGMGLALALRAVRSLKGEIELNPRGDGGTRYEFRWPIDLLQHD